MILHSSQHHDICMNQAPVHNTIMWLLPRTIVLYLCTAMWFVDVPLCGIHNKIIVHLCTKPQCITLACFSVAESTSLHTTTMILRPIPNRDIFMHRASVHKTVMSLRQQQHHDRCMRQASVHETFMLLMPQQNQFVFMHKPSVHKTSMISLRKQHHLICVRQASVNKTSMI